MPTDGPRPLSSWILAPVFALAALAHAIALIWPGALEPSPPWRHALFLAVNGGFALAFWFRPRGLRVAFAALCAQQLYSHGRFALELWTREHRIDWASAVVLLGLPLAFALVVRERR